MIDVAGLSLLRLVRRRSCKGKAAFGNRHSAFGQNSQASNFRFSAKPNFGGDIRNWLRPSRSAVAECRVPIAECLLITDGPITQSPLTFW